MTTTHTPTREFLGYTCGLLRLHTQFPIPKLVKIEFTRLEGGVVELHAVSGNNRADMHTPRVFVSAEAWSDRPTDAYQDEPETKWAMRLCGWN